MNQSEFNCEKILSQKFKEKNSFFDKCYFELFTQPSLIYESGLSRSQKRNILDILIYHFEAKEEYKKCKYLHDIFITL